MNRLERLRRRLAEDDLGAILISQADNRRYLSGFVGTAGHLLISQQRAVLATDFRYTEQARKQAPDFEVVELKGEMERWLPELLGEVKPGKLGFEAGDISFAAYQKLEEARGKINPPPELVPTQRLVEYLRAVKEPGELEHLSQAAQLADAAMGHLLTIIRPGITESEAAWELERFMRERGSERVPFDPIVASGPNAALPHARPSPRAIPPGQPVIIDIGAQVGGYASDLSRTLCLGDGDPKFTEVYTVVQKAQKAALDGVRPGMTGEEADRLARQIIEEAGYGSAFGHGLGHGVGLGGHEEPRLGPGSPDLLVEGMVFTIEPGIYLPGWGGVRIEDMVVLESDGPRPLSRAEKITIGERKG
ncbi:MAG: M24 family metallopeptidase [Dehalococcoidia bacterium]